MQAWPLMNAYKVTIFTRCYGPPLLTVPVQDFSDGVKSMKQLKRTETGAEGNLNVILLAVLVLFPPECVQ